MGANEVRAFTTIVLPIILPSGFAFAYMTVDFTPETIPIKTLNALRYGYTPTMASVTILFVAVAGAVFSAVAFCGDLPRLLGAWGRGDR